MTAAASNKPSTADFIRACDRLATPRGTARPLASLTRVAKLVEPCAKVRMPRVAGLAKDPLDDVAPAHPLGYLPEIRALLAKGADAWGLMRWTSSMEGIALYATARVFEIATPIKIPEATRSVRVAREHARVVYGDFVVRGDLRNLGALVVLGDLRVQGQYIDDAEDGLSQLAVLGTATMRFGNVYGGMTIRGDLRATDAFHAAGHESSLFVGGEVTTPVLALNEKTLRDRGRICRLVLESRYPERADRAKMKRLLVPAMFTRTGDDEDGLPVDLHMLVRRAGKGMPLFRVR